MKIELPSGAIGTARKFKTGDLQDLADGMEDDQLATEGVFLLVRSSWIQVTDAGPYAEEVMAIGTQQPEWPRVLKGDTLGALLQTRVGSFRDGHIYEFDTECERCEEPIKWEVDLQSAVIDKVKRLPEASYEHLRSGEPLTTRLYNSESGERDGPVVSFRLQTVASEAPFNELRKKQLKQRRKSPKPNIVDQLASQVVSVEGQNLGNERRVWQWVHGLDLEVSLALQDDFEAADCGYETEIEIRCDQCRRRQKVDLPLQKSFLVPSRRNKKKTDDDDQDQQSF